MIHDSFPPLLRAIGTTVILAATVIAFVIARQHVAQREAHHPPAARTAGKPSATSDVQTLAAEVEELRSEVEAESVAEEVLENRWFEWLGFAGTANVASSFYTEWYVRRKKSRAG